MEEDGFEFDEHVREMLKDSDISIPDLEDVYGDWMAISQLTPESNDESPENEAFIAILKQLGINIEAVGIVGLKIGVDKNASCWGSTRKKTTSGSSWTDVSYSTTARASVPPTCSASSRGCSRQGTTRSRRCAWRWRRLPSASTRRHVRVPSPSCPRASRSWARPRSLGSSYAVRLVA